MRKYGKVDANHTHIVKALRALGCSVQSLASLGNGVPDLLVARNGRMALMEVKDGMKSPSQRKLTDDEFEWIQKWNAPVYVITSVDEAVAAIQSLY